MKWNNTLIYCFYIFFAFHCSMEQLRYMIVLKHNWYSSTTECGEEILILLWSSE